MSNKAYIPRHSPEGGAFVPLSRGLGETFDPNGFLPPTGICVEFYILDDGKKPLQGVTAQLSGLGKDKACMTVFVAIEGIGKHRVVFAEDVACWREVEETTVLGAAELFKYGNSVRKYTS